MDNCRHVSKVKVATDHSILNPQKWMCTICGTTESVWACLSCSNVACGRYNEEHALKHYEETKHPIALEVNEKYVYCYECDEYVLNDNAAGDIKLLRETLKAIATHSFHDVETRGKRILRSRSYAFEGKVVDKLRRADMSFTALIHRRLVLLGKVFFALRQWKDLQKTSKDSSSFPGTAVTLSPVITPTKKKSTLLPGVTGLRNLGNTCYMNSILQVLGHLSDFRDFFLNLDVDLCKTDDVSLANKKFQRLTSMECFQHLSEKSTKGGLNGGSSTSRSSEVKQVTNSPAQTSVSLCHELHALFRVMWSGKWALVSPHAVLNAVWMSIPFFKGYSQQDAQEFLCELLDRIQSELHSIQRTQKLGTIPVLDNRVGPAVVETEESVIDITSNIFQGQLLSEVKCLDCGEKSERLESFMDLSLEFPERYHDVTVTPSEKTCHITEMLTKFTDVEKLDGKIYACEHCNDKRRKVSNKPTLYCEAEKRLLLKSLPKCIRLHLKRFRWSGRLHREKINIHVSFEQVLNLQPFCHPSCCGDNHMYELSAVVIHHGRGFGSGHYTTYCWNEDIGSWTHCNDVKIELCSINDVVKCQAYILLYTLKTSTDDLAHPLDNSGEDDSDEEIVFNFKSQGLHKSLNKRRPSYDGAGRITKRRRTTTW